MHQREATGRELSFGLEVGTHAFAAVRPELAFDTARTFDGLLRGKKCDRIQILCGLAAASDVTRSGRQTEHCRRNEE